MSRLVMWVMFYYCCKICVCQEIDAMWWFSTYIPNNSYIFDHITFVDCNKMKINFYLSIKCIILDWYQRVCVNHNEVICYFKEVINFSCVLRNHFVNTCICWAMTYHMTSKFILIQWIPMKIHTQKQKH